MPPAVFVHSLTSEFEFYSSAGGSICTPPSIKLSEERILSEGRNLLNLGEGRLAIEVDRAMNRTAGGDRVPVAGFFGDNLRSPFVGSRIADKGAGFLRWVLCQPGDLRQGGWKRHHGAEALSK